MIEVVVIEISTASTWLNWENPSELTTAGLAYIEAVQDPYLADEERKILLRDVYTVLRRTNSMLEKAEILVNCSCQAYLLAEIEDAGRWLDTAAQFYEYCDDNHRYAVTLWMLFIVRRAKGQYHQAFHHARRARRLFSVNASDRAQKKRVEDESWYRGRIIDMTCDLVSSPEDMFELLFEFSASKLSPSALDIRNRISNRLERKQFDRIDQDIQLLLGITLRSAAPVETAEAFAFCGVVAWVLEDRGEALNYFRSAMTLYLPVSFEYAVLEWMSGLALLIHQRDYAMAIHIMEKSILDMDQLRVKAIHDNKIETQDWFAIHHHAMKRVLRTRIEEL